MAKSTQTSHSSPKPEIDPVVANLRAQIVALQRIASLGVIASSVCHELNNALTPVLSFTKLALRNPDPEYRKKALERILEGAERAAGITGGVLALSRPELDRRDPTDLKRLVDDILRITAKELEKHRVSVTVKVAGQPRARLNPAQIQQVLLNLIVNARQAMPQGGAIQIRVGLDSTNRWAEIAISDTGTGIAAPDLKRIFEPFFSTKTTPDSTGLGGTGLGLPVCRDIVEAHKGRIRVESRVGHGTTFTVRLPAVRNDAAKADSSHTGAA
jgi:signal transduction histidine kinase